ncbi:stage II sporulation protein M [Lutispora sp.]|uniref:stage II sporulation protein M n=1 Tax=Lutispora sp. TaxID=2828727 RepID=UPI0035672C93
MFGKLNYLIIKHIRENGLFYLGFVIIFSIGISFGAYWVNNLTIETRDLLSRYIYGFFSLIPVNELDNLSILKASFINNVLSLVLLLILGLTYAGVVFSPLYIIFKGFCFGFSVGFLVESFGRKGLIFSIVSLLPHSIISIPGTIFLCVVSIQYSLYILKNRKEKRYENKRQSFINYLFSFMLGAAMIMLASLVESYITPIFIKGILPFII